MRACAGRPVQEPGGQMMCPAGPDRGRARGGEMPSAGRSSAGRSSAGWPASGRGGRRSRRRLAAASAVGAGHRLLAMPGQLLLSRSHTGCHRAGGPLANLVPQAALS